MISWQYFSILVSGVIVYSFVKISPSIFASIYDPLRWRNIKKKIFIVNFLQWKSELSVSVTSASFRSCIIYMYLRTWARCDIMMRLRILDYIRCGKAHARNIYFIKFRTSGRYIISLPYVFFCSNIPCNLRMSVVNIGKWWITLTMQ